MRKITDIILHCSATPEGRDIHADTIRNWHKQQGWRDIGYHYVITLDGKVERGRPLDKVGAHCVGHNTNSIGICYVGGIDKQGKVKDTRTPAQTAALHQLVKTLQEEYHIPDSNVHCHNEYSAKACPSFSIETFRKEHHSTIK